MPFRSEKQRRWMWANEPKMARKWTDEHGSTPVKAKKGKYQELKHPQHDITPVEHMEEKVSSKERVEKLLEDRKTKKESKKKLVKDGQGFTPGWKPQLSVKAAEGELIRQKTRGTGIAVKGTEHYTMAGMPTAYQGQLIQTPTRGTGAAVKGTDHYIMPGMDAAKTGKLIKAKESKWITVKPKTKVPNWDKSLKNIRETYKLANELKTEDKLTKWDLENARKIIKSGRTPPHHSRKTGGPIKAKKGSYLTTGLKGFSHKKVSSKTSQKFFDLFKHREAGSYKQATSYKKYLKSLGKMTKATKAAKASVSLTALGKAKASTLGSSKFVQRRMTLAGAQPLTSVLKTVGKRTGLGKAVAAATVVAGAYEAGKRKLFTKDKKKKKVDKKSIGGETVVMKSGGGYIDDLL